MHRRDSEPSQTLIDVVGDIRSNLSRYYVYILRKPDGRPFYVGVGRSRDKDHQRVQDHGMLARGKDRSWKSIVIRSIWNAGGQVHYGIDGWHDSEAEVFAREVELIESIGRKDLGVGPLVNGNAGGTGQFRPSAEIRAKISATKKAAIAADPEARARASARTKEVMRRPGVRERLSAAAKLQFSKPGAGAAVSAQNHRRFSDPAAREAAASRARKRNSTAEAKAAFAERMSGLRPAALLKSAEVRRADPTWPLRMSVIKKKQAAEKAEFRARVIATATALGVARNKLPVNRAALSIWVGVGQQYGVAAQ